MSELLPILREHSAPMTLCAVCPKPGYCCNGFKLNRTFWNDLTPAEVTAEIQAMDLPYVADRAAHEYGEWFDDDTQREYGYWFFSCPKLRDDGRCGIYATRPETCRSYLPASDALCIFGPDRYTPSVTPISEETLSKRTGPGGE